MSMHLQNITMDCRDAVVLSAFWSAVLGSPVDEGAEVYFASIGRIAGAQPTYFFTQVPEDKAAKNRVHLDFHCDNRSVEIPRLVALGANHIADKDEWGVAWSVMQDPEGNEFCVAGPYLDA